MEKIKASLDNFVTQLLAFQQQIIDRDGIPTDKEMAFQVRTVNAMAKLEKMIARDAAAKAREQREQQKLRKLQDVKAELATIPSEPPVTHADYDEYYDFICSSPTISETDTTEFHGRTVNAVWLEYNLFQYMLPAEERRFVYNIDLLNINDYREYREQMFDFVDRTAA